jgi:hypothetical protein
MRVPDDLRVKLPEDKLGDGRPGQHTRATGDDENPRTVLRLDQGLAREIAETGEIFGQGERDQPQCRRALVFRKWCDHGKADGNRNAVGSRAAPQQSSRGLVFNLHEYRAGRA